MSTNELDPLTLEQVAVVVEMFEADPVDWIFRAAEDMANQLLARGGMDPSTPRERMMMYTRITPSVVDFMREHGYVGNDVACATAYVAIGAECRCTTKHVY